EIGRSAQFRLMPGARAVIEQLARRGATLGLATGNTHEGARIKLAQAALGHHFAGPDGALLGGFGSDSADRPTLVRVGIERAARPLGREVPAAEVLVVGDTPHDVTAAHAVGVRVAAVATGGHSVEELAAVGADEVYPTLNEMLPTL